MAEVLEWAATLAAEIIRDVARCDERDLCIELIATRLQLVEAQGIEIGLKQAQRVIQGVHHGDDQRQGADAGSADL